MTPPDVQRLNALRCLARLDHWRGDHTRERPTLERLEIKAALHLLTTRGEKPPLRPENG